MSKLVLLKCIQVEYFRIRNNFLCDFLAVAEGRDIFWMLHQLLVVVKKSATLCSCQIQNFGYDSWVVQSVEKSQNVFYFSKNLNKPHKLVPRIFFNLCHCVHKIWSLWLIHLSVSVQKFQLLSYLQCFGKFLTKRSSSFHFCQHVLQIVL